MTKINSRQRRSNRWYRAVGDTFWCGRWTIADDRKARRWESRARRGKLDWCKPCFSATCPPWVDAHLVIE